MKKIVLSFLAISLGLSISAQINSNFEKVIIETHQLNQAAFQLTENRTIFKASAISEISLQDIDPFLSYSLVIHTKGWDEHSKMQVYFNDGEKQSEATLIELDPHTNELRPDQFTSRLYFTDKNTKKIRLHYTGHYEIEKVELFLFNPGKTENFPTPYQPSTEFRSACPCPQPPFLDREGWCPDGSCPIDATPEWTTVTHLIVHHSATSNTSSDWPAVVRSIWNSHVNGNGWDDIGYNWLIDPEGNIYQGRFDNQQGAHFCSKNQGTMGVCVIGNYTDELPTFAALTALEELFAWKTCDVAIDPLGSGWHWISGEDLMHISGHRDGCSTACPGDTFYPTLFTVREGVHQLLETECGGFAINAPTNLWADIVPPDFVNLTWEDNADNETGYQIERSKEYNDDFALIATIPANSDNYVDGSLDDFTTEYYYRVRAITGDSASTYSNEAIISPFVNTTYILDENIIDVFPNPTNGKLYINAERKTNSDLILEFFDVFGRTVNPEINTQSMQMYLDISHLTTGFYFLKISSVDGFVTKRILKN